MSANFTATDWSRYDIPAIAAMLPADDYTDSWNQVMAWRLAAETASVHLAALRTARADLADAWPPDRSLAAQNFLAYVDVAERTIEATADAAHANATALANTLVALTDAQSQIAALHERWQANAGPVSGGPAPSMHSPATPGQAWAATLNAKAHQVMADTDQVVLAGVSPFL